MPAFIKTEDGYFNLDQVSAVIPDGREYSIKMDGKFYPAPAGFERTIVQVIPVDGDWEVLSRDKELPDGVLAEPIVAWGLTVDGEIVPITPRDRSGVLDAAWRRKGAPAVYEVDAAYADVREWLKS